jgi:hypothetical protein
LLSNSNEEKQIGSLCSVQFIPSENSEEYNGQPCTVKILILWSPYFEEKLDFGLANAVEKSRYYFQVNKSQGKYMGSMAGLSAKF